MCELQWWDIYVLAMLSFMRVCTYLWSEWGNKHYIYTQLAQKELATAIQNYLIFIFINHFQISNRLISLQWRNNECDGVSDHQPHECLLNHLSRCRSKKTSRLRTTGLYQGIRWWLVNSPQMASNAENVSIWWRHRVFQLHVTHLSAHNLPFAVGFIGI